MTDVKSYKVVMPKLGLIMEEANLLEWHKANGELVTKGELLFSFESDKSTVEIESPASGILQTLVDIGTTIPVGTPVAMIYPEGAEIEDPKVVPVHQDKTLPEISEVIHPTKSVSQLERIRATPKARKAALLRGIDLESITGTGPRGMIVTSDLDTIPAAIPVKATPVAHKIAADCNIDLRKVTGTGPGGRITRDDVTASIAALTKSAKPAPVTGIVARTSLPLNGLRGLIAERLSASWNERPQVTLHSEVDATNLVEFRQHNRTSSGKKITLNAFFVTAAARALSEFPGVNSQLTDNGIIQYGEINIGLAIDTERGLVVPVLKDAGKMSLIGIDAGLSDLVERTLANKALPEDFSGGTFTITNLGAYGVDSFTPIINPPEASILGIGRITPRPVAVNGMLGVREMVTLSLSFDHRLIDGAPAARFLQRICQLIENP
jgi:pyruvate dehydrogenase E2 component (dihydrolipoamide acetyltransferase)